MKEHRYQIQAMRKNPAMWARLALKSHEDLRAIHARAWRTVAILAAPQRGHQRAAGHSRYTYYDEPRANQDVAWRLLDVAQAAHILGMRDIGIAEQALWGGKLWEYWPQNYRPSFDFPNEVAS